MLNPANKRTPNLLVVDDSLDNLFLLESILQAFGYEVTTAEDGYSALLKVEQSPPDLILLDVMMPGINGYEVIQRIRQNRKLPFIPILLITAADRLDFGVNFNMRAEAILYKPLEINELLAQVQNLLDSKYKREAQNSLSFFMDKKPARLSILVDDNAFETSLHGGG
ncbi:MAG TPA: hypothetical protein DDZ80_21125 [Cyanobacteria bacterium UBA8803]|nr:hypothetical protein [Cyanobacteria bacterium UBA9273]HBL60845.1 hypothetical protein [Cyanobacteria bacterium UBA8803]